MRKLLRPAENALWFLVLLCATILAVDTVRVVAAQRSAASITAAAMPGDSTPSHAAGASRDASAPPTVLGRLEIPALRLTTPIVDDSDTQSLLRGAGHIRGTALPGGLGNFVVAAHRDTFFRPLRGIRPGMTIKVVTPTGDYTYMVDSTKIVNPEDVDVLDMGDVPQMTLITCYPFHYIGAAPKRFAVRAHLVSY